MEESSKRHRVDENSRLKETDDSEKVEGGNRREAICRVIGILNRSWIWQGFREVSMVTSATKADIIFFYLAVG